jgi:hypothetical protein
MSHGVAQPPVTDAERVVATIAMLVGASCYAYIVGSLSGLVANLDPIEANFRHVMDSLNRCARACAGEQLQQPHATCRAGHHA